MAIAPQDKKRIADNLAAGGEKELIVISGPVAIFGPIRNSFSVLVLQ